MADASRLGSTRLSRRFWRHEAGNIAVMFGLLLLPMLGGMGLAIDYGSVLTARNKGQVAADAAALQASGVARDLIKSSDGSDAATAIAIAEAKRRAELLFKAHADQSGLTGYSATVTITRSGVNITSSASFTVNTTTYLAKLFGQKTYAATGAASSKSSLPTYVDVYVLMDISQSMGLAATNAEAVRLFKLTSPSCVFGCHVKQSGQSSTLPFEQIAQNNGIKLRIDVLRDAVTEMITDAQNKSYGDSIYRFGLYSMGLNSGKSTYALNELSAISGNYTTVKAAATGIDLSSNNDASGIGDSYINEQLSQLKLKIPNSGDGTSQAKARVYVFLVTDGVRDYKSGSCTSGHCVSAIDPSYCAPFKTTVAGITVGVLYTTYLPIYADPRLPNGALEGNYAALVKPISTNIAPALASCASSGWYFEASDDQGISAAFDKMFSQTSSAPALTN